MYWWSDERKALVQRLWAEGLSARQIGKQLALTRNAIIGAVHRMALPKRAPSTLRDPAQRRYNGNKPPKFRFGAPTAPKNRASSRLKSAVEPSPPLAADPVLFMERISTQCSWILDDKEPISSRQCCGGPAHRRTSWCEYHLNRVAQR